MNYIMNTVARRRGKKKVNECTSQSTFTWALSKLVYTHVATCTCKYMYMYML